MSLSRGKKFLLAAMLIFIGVILAGGFALHQVLSGKVVSEWGDTVQWGRSVDRARKKATRIMVLGDSFLVKWPMKPCLHEELKHYFEKEGAGVVNLASSGKSPWFYRDQALKYGPKLKPDLVLIFYYIGNDLADELYRDRPVSPTPANVPPRQGEVDWAWFRANGVDPKLIKMARTNMEQPGKQEEPVNWGLLLLAVERKRLLLDSIFIDTEQAMMAWRKVEVKLAEIVTWARKEGADVCIVGIPSTAQVDRSHHQVFRQMTFMVDPRLATSTKPQELLSKFCQTRGITFVDLLPDFKAHRSPDKLFYTYDDHFTSKGHGLAFDVLRRRFLDKWTERRQTRVR
jgi:hypothetical protein